MTTAEETTSTTTLEPTHGLKGRLASPEFRRWFVELVRFVVAGGASFVITRA